MNRKQLTTIVLFAALLLVTLFFTLTLAKKNDNNEHKLRIKNRRGTESPLTVSARQFATQQKLRPIRSFNKKQFLNKKQALKRRSKERLQVDSMGDSLSRCQVCQVVVEGIKSYGQQILHEETKGDYCNKAGFLKNVCKSMVGQMIRVVNNKSDAYLVCQGKKFCQ